MSLFYIVKSYVKSSKCLTIELTFSEEILMAKGSSVVHYCLNKFSMENDFLLLQSRFILLVAFNLIFLASSSALRLTMIFSCEKVFKYN